MSGYSLTGFELRAGRAVARFHGPGGDWRALPVDATAWLPDREDEQSHPDPAVHAQLIRTTAQLAAIARTAHVVLAHDDARRPIAGRQRRRTPA